MTDTPKMTNVFPTGTGVPEDVESSFQKWMAAGRNTKWGAKGTPNWMDPSHWQLAELDPKGRRELEKAEGRVMVPRDVTHWARVSDAFVQQHGHVPPEGLYSPTRGWWTCGDDPPPAVKDQN